MGAEIVVRDGDVVVVVVVGSQKTVNRELLVSAGKTESCGS